MKKFSRPCALALFCLAASAISVSCLAQSAFNGTWRTDAAKTKFSTKPNVSYISQGWYHCVSCNPAFDVAADGQSHPVAGHAYDAITVTIVDSNSISLSTSKDGKAVSEQTRTVSSDGKTLTVKTISHPKDGSPALTFTTVAKRDGIAPSGVHATSGNWILQSQTGSEAAYTVTYKVDGDQITMTQPDGESYTAKLDGTDAPYNGAYGFDTVSVKKIGANAIEEIDKRGGNVIDDAKLTVSGNTMTVVSTDVPTGRTSTRIAHKTK
jgi:endonuclease YncB( thermonuclease family)